LGPSDGSSVADLDALLPGIAGEIIDGVLYTMTKPGRGTTHRDRDQRRPPTPLPIWLASEEGKVSVLGAGGEWKVLAVNDLGEDCYATPALSEGVIYLRTEEALYAFGSAATTE